MADATPEPRADLVQRARATMERAGIRAYSVLLRDEWAAAIAAALADVEREAERRVWRRFEDAVVQKSQVPIKEGGGVVERCRLCGRNWWADEPSEHEPDCVLKLLDPKEPGDA